MRRLLVPAVVSITLLAAAACTSGDDEEAASSIDALTTLTNAQCQTPAVRTTPKRDSSGATIAGSAHTTLSGCIVGSQGETGDAVVARLTALLGNTARLGTVKKASGAPVFQQFTPGVKRGTLATSITQDIDVTLAMDHSPYTKLHTVQRKRPGVPYSLSISNSTAVSASVAFFTVTVVYPGELSLNLDVKAAANGIMVTGASDIILQQEQDQAASASVLVSDLFRWLASELARTAPPPVAPPPAPASDAGDASDATDSTDASDASARDASDAAADAPSD